MGKKHCNFSFLYFLSTPQKSFQPGIFFVKHCIGLDTVCREALLRGSLGYDGNHSYDSLDHPRAPGWYRTWWCPGDQTPGDISASQVPVSAKKEEKVILYGNADAFQSLLWLARRTKGTISVMPTLIPLVQCGFGVTSVTPTMSWIKRKGYILLLAFPGVFEALDVQMVSERRTV